MILQDRKQCGLYPGVQGRLHIKENMHFATTKCQVIVIQDMELALCCWQ